MEILSEPIPPATDSEAQLNFLFAHWDQHHNLDGIVLPEGSDTSDLALKAIRRGVLMHPQRMPLCDALCCLPVGEQGPTNWDSLLDRVPPGTVMRAIVEHGTDGAISLDICPYGTLVATAEIIRKRVSEGLVLMTLQPETHKS